MSLWTTLCFLVTLCCSARSACYNRTTCVGCENWVFDCCLGNAVERQTSTQNLGNVGFYNQSGPVSSFYIQSTYTPNAADNFFVTGNGTVWTNKTLERNRTDCWVFTVTIQGQQAQQVIVAVGVIGINYYPPVFSGLPTNVTLPVTNAARSITNLCYSITDGDSGVNGNVSTVQIVAGNSMGMFEVIVKRLSSLTQVCVTNTGPLDGRNVNRFNLTLLASDQGTPQLNSTTWIVVQLTGVNYYSPVFKPLPQLRPLPDNTPVGKVIQTFVATDNDTGDNGRVTYSIQQPQDSHFTINSTSGELVLSSKFDPAISVPQYTVCVTATDSSPTFPLSSSTCITISVVPSSPPTFGSVDVSPGCPVNIVENSLNPTVTLYSFTIITGSAVHCIILQGSANFTVTNYHGIPGYLVCTITVSGFLDFERASQLNITIGVTWDTINDTSLLDLYEIHKCTVNVIDTNDNAPMLNQTHFAFEEKQSFGSYVAQLVGYDLDYGVNGTIAKYLLLMVSNTSTDLTNLSLFDLDQKTGLITTKNVIERKKVGKKLYITVLVQDGGTPPMTSIIVVQLDVIAVLAFSSDSYAFFLFNNLPAPLTMGRVVATGGGDSSIPVSYELVATPTLFAVDAQGNVTAQVPFISVGVYNYSVLARDHSNPPVSSIATVTIHVLDICSSAQNLTGYSDMKVGNSLGTVLRDISIGPELNYNISSSDIFEIIPTTGVVVVKSVPDSNLWDSFYLVTFTVFNRNFRSVSAQCTVTVLVLKVTPGAAALVIGASIGPALLLLLCLCVVMIMFYCYRRHHRKKINISGSSSQVPVQLSDLTGASRVSSPKGILSPRASAGGSNANGSVKFSYTAEEFLVNRQECVNKADTTRKTYPSVKFQDSPQPAQRSQGNESSVDLSSPLGESNPHSQAAPPSASSPHSNPHSLYPPHSPLPSARPMSRPAMGYPPTHEDMLDHSLATNAGRTHLSDPNSCDESTYSDTSIRNTNIPRFKQGSEEPLGHYLGHNMRNTSPPSFLPPSSVRMAREPPAFTHRDYIRSPTSPQHTSSSMDMHTSTSLHGKGRAPVFPGPQMVPQPGPPPIYYPEVMPSALDHSEMSSSMTHSRYSLAESFASSALDEELKFQQDDNVEGDFYNLTYNEDASEL